jgi:hypothetical protein
VERDHCSALSATEKLKWVRYERTLVLSFNGLEVADKAVGIAYAVRTLKRKAWIVDRSDAIPVVFLSRHIEPVSYARSR